MKTGISFSLYSTGGKNLDLQRWRARWKVFVSSLCVCSFFSLFCSKMLMFTVRKDSWTYLKTTKSSWVCFFFFYIPHCIYFNKWLISKAWELTLIIEMLAQVICHTWNIFFLLERLFPNPWDHLMWKVAVSTYSQGHGKNAPAQGNRLVMQR